MTRPLIVNIPHALGRGEETQPDAGAASDLYDFIHAIFLLRAMLPTSHLTHFRSGATWTNSMLAAARACYCLAPSAASRVCD